jgi:hypothetical protein
MTVAAKVRFFTEKSTETPLEQTLNNFWLQLNDPKGILSL